MRRFGWTPQQYARINEKREARGLEPYSVEGSDQYWMEQYGKEYAKRSGKVAKEETPRRRFPETDEDETQVVKMGPAKTPRLDEYKLENERLAQRRRVREMDRGMTAASQMRMMA